MSETTASLTELLPAPDELVVDDEITLAKFTVDDATAAYQLVDDNREFLGRTQSWATDFTPEMASAGISMMVANSENGLTAPYKIIEHGLFVGSVSLNSRNDDSAIMGYWLVESAEGRGVVARSARRLADFGLNEWGLSKIILEIDDNNLRSQRTAEKLGAVVVGKNPEDADESIWEIARHG